MVSTINVNNAIKEPPREYQSCNMSQNVEIWWVCLGERIVVSLSYYLGQYHSKSYSGTRVHLTRHESVAWNREPNGIENKNTHTHTHKKIWNPHYRYPNGIKRKTISTQHWYLPIYIPPFKIIHSFIYEHCKEGNWISIYIYRA